jgi:signal transduction histidine kinase
MPMDKRPGVVLVVDDDEEFQLYVKTTLEASGFEAVTVGTLGAAESQLARRRFDLVLTDLRLPSASGLDVLASARRLDPLSVGIVVTGHSSLDTAMEALREGAYDYLPKPCDPDALAAAARRGVEHYRLKQALIEKTRQLETLEAQLQSRSKMIQNVSHELKNPLSVVYGYSSFLLNHGEDVKPEDMKRSMQSIHTNAERLGHLLEELVDSVRLHGRKLELRPEPTSAAKLCHDASESYRLEAEKRGLKLSLNCDTDALVLADAKRMAQVFGNLIGNAFKFTREGGVTISAREEKDCVVFTVADTGCGVSPQELPHLFERFFQTSDMRKDHTGLGLGLDICKGIVELHGGTIRAESAPGKGTAFHFTLPLTPARPNR